MTNTRGSLFMMFLKPLVHYCVFYF